MILQACIDESASRTTSPGGFFVLAGLIASREQWAALSVKWDEALKESPTLEYFKLSEALAMKYQFDPSRGWIEEERDKSVGKLARITRDHALAGYSVIVPRDDYNEFVRAFVKTKALRDPYFFCFYQIVDAISESRDWLGGSQTLMYIFDENGAVSRRAIDYWHDLRSKLSWRQPASIGEVPIHEDEKKFLPLQAADLWVGLVRALQDEIAKPGTVGIRQKWLDIFDGMPVNERMYSRERLMELGATLVVQTALKRSG